MKQLADSVYWYACLGFAIAIAAALLIEFNYFGVAAFAAIVSITHGVRWAIKNGKDDMRGKS